MRGRHQRSSFSAISSLLAAAVQRAAAQPSATFAGVDILLPDSSPNKGTSEQARRLAEQLQQPLLLVEDDAVGMSAAELRACLGIAHCGSADASSSGSDGSVTYHGSGSGSGEVTWTDFVHAALCLGSAALVLTRRRQHAATVGLLCARKEHVEAAAVDVLLGCGSLPCSSSSSVASVAAVAAAAGSLAPLCQRWAGSATGASCLTEAVLLQQLAGICMYQKNRLVRPFWRPAAFPGTVLGYVDLSEADLIEPEPDYQGLKPSPLLAKLEWAAWSATP
ncbi:hypothetical protein ABPG75_000838 [Micractinium tetrahymenae]